MSRIRAHTMSDGVPGAPLLVLVHGLEDSWTSWQPLAAELNPDWRLVALDLPWRPGNDYRWRDRTSGQWLGEALDLLDATPDVLVAHSFGANAAMQLACALDCRVGRALALVCPLYREPRHRVSWRMFDRSRATFVDHIREGVRAKMGARVRTTDPDVLEDMVDMTIDRIGPSGFLTVFDNFAASADLPLGNIELPTVVVAAGIDPTLSRQAANALADGMPGAGVRVHDDYDHFCHVRQALGVAAEIADLVDTVCGTATTTVTTRTAGDLR